MYQLFRIIFFISLICSPLPVLSDDFPAIPYPPRLVNDYTGFLSDDEREQLEQKLVSFNRETSTQIAVVIVEDLKGYDKADYALQLGRKWGIGQEGKNNGILILIKPKTSASQGEVFIAPGYGLEGVVPDAIAKRIVENEILPAFRNGNYFEGIDNAVNTLMNLTKGEFTAEQSEQQTKNTDPGIVVFIILFVLIALFSIIGKLRAARQYSIGHNIPFWLALMMLSGSRNSHQGSFGDFSSGRGSFGGFGGFGGGSFGGGGAGGSW
ncbi:MAG TPA: TPM domain-containing protein [Bacteroidales bacterium]|nr:TPM domain-containing protein [Bacteroidales bacterium]